MCAEKYLFSNGQFTFNMDSTTSEKPERKQSSGKKRDPTKPDLTLIRVMKERKDPDKKSAHGE